MRFIPVISEIQPISGLSFLFYKMPMTGLIRKQLVVLIENQDVGKTLRFFFIDNEISFLFGIHLIHHSKYVAIGILHREERDDKGKKEAWYQNDLAISTKSRDLRLAPPTNPPSTSRQENNSAAFPGFTLPP